MKSKWMFSAVGLVVGTLTLAACGTDSKAASTGSSKTPAQCLAAAKAFSAPYTKPVGPDLPSSKLKISDAMKSKTIWAVFPQLTAPAFIAAKAAYEEAASAAGVKLQVFDGQGNPAKMNEGVVQAVNNDAGAIILNTLDTTAVKQSLEAAFEKNIPVVTLFSAPDPRDFADFTVDYELVGKLQGSAALEAGGCKGTYGYLNTTSIAAADTVTRAAKSFVDATCDSCKSDVQDIPITELATRTGPTAQTLARSHGDLAAILAAGTPLQVAAPALSQIGSKATLHGYAGNPANLQMVVDGKEQSEVAFMPTSFYGWQIIDAALRGMAGADPLKRVVLPVRLVTKDSLAGKPDAFPSLPSAAETFKELWAG